MDDEKFISGLNQKDGGAWKRLYEEFYAPLCAYAEKLSKGQADAEDVVQDCMVELWDSSLCFPNVKALTAWLYKVVYTRTLNALRDKANAEQSLAEYAVEIPTEDEAADEAAEENAVARLRKMMKVLTPQQQDILRMTLDGLKVKDIAAALGVTDNTVKMQKKRAYTTLRERFGKAGTALLVMFFSWSCFFGSGAKRRKHKKQS